MKLKEIIDTIFKVRDKKSYKIGLTEIFKLYLVLDFIQEFLKSKQDKLYCKLQQQGIENCIQEFLGKESCKYFIRQIDLSKYSLPNDILEELKNKAKKYAKNTKEL